MRKLTTAGALALLFCVACAFVSASQEQKKPGRSASPVSDVISGHYEGVAKSQSLGDIPITINLKNDNGKLTGAVLTPFVSAITGTYAAGKLTIKFDADGDEVTITAQQSEDRIVGSFSSEGNNGTLELKRTGAASTVALTSNTLPNLSLSKEQWREDLQFLANQLAKRHKNAFHTITREQFMRAVAELDSAIPTLQNHQIVVGMRRIASLIGDGHTGVRLPDSFRRYPINLYWFGNELRVTRTTATYRRALGAQVVKIGAMDTTEVHKAVSRLIPQVESEGHIRALSAAHMRSPEVLHALGITESVEQAQYTFEDAEGKGFTLDISAVSPDEKIEWLSAATNEPLYRQRQNEQFWFVALPGRPEIVYLNFKSYPNRKEFRRLSQELFSFIDRQQTKRLIIDLRQNGGGDFTKVRELLIPGLKQRAALLKPGGLFVITGRATFSAAMVNAVDFRKDVKAILVGEPTGARPNGYQENDEFRLPNSHLEVSYSTRYYKFQDEDTPGVMPDKQINITWEDFRAGRDPVLEWILAYPSGK